MYAVVAQVIILSTIGCAFPRTNTKEDDIIWFPIEDIQNGYFSSEGEYYANQQQDSWSGNNYNTDSWSSQGRRIFRSLPANRKTDTFDANAGVGGFRDKSNFKRDIDVEAISFPDDEYNSPGDRYESLVEDAVADDCRENCLNLLVSEYNPVCGTDSVNYRNVRALKCEQFCGKSVDLAHYGVCGRGLPGIFVPSPRAPRSGMEGTSMT